MEVFYLGDEHTHSYSVAKATFLSDKLTGVSNVTVALTKLYHGEGDVAVIPLENSIEGTVVETLDGLYKYGLYITAEILTPINHNLIGLKGATLNDVKKVYSHPQALGQCREFLNKRNVQAIPVAYTSQGLELIKSKDEGCLSREAIKGLEVIAFNVADSDKNATRFGVIAREPNRKGNKVSVAYELPNVAGSLLKTLEVMRDYSLNMTKIESRPDKSKFGGYVFYVDFNLNDDNLNDILTDLSDVTTNLRYLGRY